MAGRTDCILVMGVSGCGKTTVARGLAGRLGLPFVEGDLYHPPENIAAMAAGHPLDDTMRWGWLDRCAEAVVAAGPGPVILACSALKRRYRDRLRAGIGRVGIVHLAGDPALLSGRMAVRRGHFMPASLLASQIADLEPPGPDEAPLVTLDVAEPPEEIIEAASVFVRQAFSSPATEPANEPLGGDHP